MVALVEAQSKTDAFFELQLYLAGRTGRAQLVERDVRRILEQEFPNRHSLAIIDVLASPELAERANISLTPTLTKGGAKSRRRLVGAVHRREQILWLIDQSPLKVAPEPVALTGTLSDLCPDGLFLVDDDGLVLSSNKAGRELLGLTGRPAEGEVFGLPPTDGKSVNVLLASGLPAELRAVETMWNGRKAHLAMLRENTGGGPQLVYRAGLDPGEMDALIKKNAALQSTVSRSSCTIKALEEKNRDLERLIDELSAFTQRVAHDVKSPASNIRSLLKVLIDDEAAALSDGGRALLEAAQDTSQRLIGLIEALLAFSSETTIPDLYEDVNLNIILRWVMNDLNCSVREADVEYEIGDLPIVPGAPMQLYQVFLNLVGNAVKFRREGVTPHVKVFSSSVDNSHMVPMVRVEIQDNGIGFDDSVVEKIFQPFERLVRYDQIPGHGIGLATVKRMVERHGGRISATGSPGLGATFRVDLPKYSVHQSPLPASQIDMAIGAEVP